MVIIGWLVWIAGFFGYNYFFGGVTSQVVDGQYVDVSSALPLTVLFVGIVVIYWLCCINIINEWERRPVLLFGKYVRTAGPGLVLIEPLFHSTREDIPVQDVVVKVPAPQVQTKDNVGISVAAIFVYHVDPDKVRDVVVNVENFGEALLERAHAALIDTAANWELTHLLESRSNFCEEVRAKLQERVSRWGVTIRAFELTGFKITDEAIEQALAMKARAGQEGEAELTRAKYQKQVATLLKQAAAEYDEGAWRLKGQEVMIELCRSAENNTVLIPTDLLGAIQSIIPKKI
jgi:regulator of protease activity HflC (stomatin/prohibitin superfamily)